MILHNKTPLKNKSHICHKKITDSMNYETYECSSAGFSFLLVLKKDLNKDFNIENLKVCIIFPYNIIWNIYLDELA